jgi:hypothetical protein
MFSAKFRIRIDLMRIRIQHFFLIADQGLKDLLKYLFSFHEKKFQKGHFNK